MAELIKHLKLPPQVHNAMRALMDGEGGDVEAFIALIKEEPNFKSSCVRIVEELVLFAVKEGILYIYFKKLFKKLLTKNLIIN